MDKIEAAKKLFNESVESLRKNDIEGFRDLSKKADRLVKSILEGKLKELERDEVYGDWMNFGLAHKIFESNVPALFKSKEGKAVIGKYMKMVKSDRLLSEQFKAYRLFEGAEDVSDVEKFISEAISIIPRYSRKELAESVGKVISFIRENKLAESVEIPSGTRKLLEGVEYFLLNGKNCGNLEGYLKEKELLKESLEETVRMNKEKKEKKEEVQATPEDFLTEMERKYKSVLNESDMELVQAIMDAKSGHVNEREKAVYEKCKNDVLETIGKLLEESKDEEATEKLKELKEGVERKMYNEATLVKDIMDLIQLNDTLMEE